MTIEDLEEWGLGIMGMTREEFYTSTLTEMKVRMSGFLKRVLEYENVGIRHLYGLIHSGFGSLGGGRPMSEKRLWPMSLDNIQAKIKNLPKSEELVKNEKDFILKIWPDAVIKD